MSGIHTVCALANKFHGGSYFANLALKFNLKLGGRNHSLVQGSLAPIQQRLTMLMGIDVTHPPQGSPKNTPSIAAVVASIDQEFLLFPGSVRGQESKQEMVLDIADMTLERLMLFARLNQRPPEDIIIYRDGVSESQLDKVRRDELKKIQELCDEKYNRFPKPRITFIVCQKRHHTRFFPTTSASADAGHGSNPPNGTVVDRAVTMAKGGTSTFNRMSP